MDDVGSVFVVSDVHGYLDDLRQGLLEAELLDRDGRWCGGDAELWVLGDLTDRGPDGIGVVDLVRGLQRQAPGRVHVLLGNHEALALGKKRFPGGRFESSWLINGGRAEDQEGLTDQHVAWLTSLPALGRRGRLLLMHSDTVAYLRWGSSVEEINRTVAELLGGDEESCWEVWALLTSRYHFARSGGERLAGDMLDALGGEVIVHGHTIIGSLVDMAPEAVHGPLLYDDGLVLDIDGGRYAGGPLLVVRLQLE